MAYKKIFATEWLAFVKFALVPWFLSAVLFFGYDQYEFHNNYSVSLDALYAKYPEYKEREETEEELTNALVLAYFSNNDSYRQDCEDAGIIRKRPNNKIFRSVDWLTYGILQKLINYFCIVLMVIYPISQVVRLTRWAASIKKA